MSIMTPRNRPSGRQPKGGADGQPNSQPNRQPNGLEAGADEETVQLERRLFEKRRRSSRRGRRRPLVLAVVAVLLVAGAVWSVWFSSLLAVDKVQVTGTSYVAPVEVRDAAKVPTGRPLARVDLAGIRERVAMLPAVQSVRVSRAWPHGIRVDVTERQAVAVLPRGSGFRGLAADGVMFRSYDTRPAGLPEIQDEQGADKDALREAARVVGSLPPGVLTRVDHVSVKTIDQIRLVMRSGRQVVWGNASDSAQKAAVLQVLLTKSSSAIDVSVPGRPTTKP